MKISLLAIQALFMKSNKQIDLLHDMSDYTEFESKIKSGFTSRIGIKNPTQKKTTQKKTKKKHLIKPEKKNRS